MKRTYRKFRIVGVAALLLAGCSTPTVTKVQTVEVKVPVAVQPITPEQLPDVPAPLPPRSGNLSADADTLLAEVCDLVGYMRAADPLLVLSAKAPPRQLPPFPECRKRHEVNTNGNAQPPR